MKFTVVTDQQAEQDTLDRIANTLHRSLELGLTVNAENNVVVLLQNILEDTFVCKFLGNIVNLQLYALISDEETLGWLFILPVSGILHGTKNSAIYVSGHLPRIKGLLKSAVIEKGEFNKLNPDIYHTQAEYTVLGARNGSILLIAQNNTSVVTQ